MADRERESRRAREIRLIHTAAGVLGIRGEEYRELLRATTGVSSSAEMTHEQRARVIERMRELGFQRRAGAGAKTDRDLGSDPPRARKIRALWLELRDAGALRDASEAALRAFVERVSGAADPRWCTAEQASVAIEALAAWLARVHGEAPHARE